MSDSKKNFYFLNFDKMCRLCLSLNIDIVCIFNKNNQGDSSLRHRIKECITMEVSEDDGLPPNICRQCFIKVNNWYDFIQSCKESESTLRQHLCSNSTRSQVSDFDAENFQVKSEKDDEEDMVIFSEFKQEESENDSLGLFSDSDEKPLVEVVAALERNKKERRDYRLKRKQMERENSDSLPPRGRAPKAKPLCLVCHKKFSRFVELIEHQNKVHNMLDVNVKSSNALNELKMNIDAFAVFRCHICKEEFSGREDLRKHCKSVHNTKVIQPYPCSHCDRQFPAWGLLVVHERKHTGEKPYSCDICGKQKFISQTSLRRHKLMHLKIYSCEECGRDFNCDSALKAHIRCKHTKEKPYLCNICGRSFSLSAILMAHMTSHSSERKYICDVCGFASKTSGNHYRHKNTHKTGGVKSFHCETCGKSFDSKLKLTSHQIIHRPVRPHACKVCGKGFLYNNKLERHVLLVHARERPFPCSLCGKKLASKFGLGIHLKTHNRNDQLKEDKKVKKEAKIEEVQTEVDVQKLQIPKVEEVPKIEEVLK